MTNLERFWLDLIDGRRYTINEVYGNEAMIRYRPHPREKELFLANGGSVPYDEEVEDHTRRFWAFCDEHYKAHREKYEARIQANGRKSRNYPEYKSNEEERRQLAEKIKAVILDHAKETQHQDGQ